MHSMSCSHGRPSMRPCRDAVPLFQERIVAVVSDDNPLASRKTLRMRDLAGEPLLLFDRHIMPVLYDKVLDLCSRTGITGKIIPTPGAGPHNHAGLMLVASGKGMNLVHWDSADEPPTRRRSRGGADRRPGRDHR